jgi:hypothetical protein
MSQTEQIQETTRIMPRNFNDIEKLLSPALKQRLSDEFVLAAHTRQSRKPQLVCSLGLRGDIQ